MPNWIEVVSEEDLEAGAPIVVVAAGREICVVLADGDLYAVANECPNDGQPLGEGDIVDGVVLVCPKGDARFDVTTGEVVLGADTELDTFEVRVVDGVVQVGLE